MTTNARELTVRLADLLRRERAAMADFLVALAEFDRRRAWAALGYSGLFSFLERELGMSKAAAFYRKTAAELVQKFPEIVEPLRDGRLCITAIVELAKVITVENRAEVMPRFFSCSKREAKAVAAALAPDVAPPRRDVVTPIKLAVVEQPACAVVQPVELTHSENAHRQAPANAGGAPVRAPAAALALAPTPPRDSADPLTADLSRLHVTVSRRFLEKLDRAKAALSHSHPGASAEEILEAGLDLVLAQQAKRRGLVEKPRKVSRTADGDRIPAQAKRAVWTRDGGRCQWRLDSGGVCGSTLRVEIDHVLPRARGGVSTVENLRLLCRFHNDLAARQKLGDGCMDRYTRGCAPGVSHPATSPPE